MGTGNTVITTASLLSLPVHPRGYGEHPNSLTDLVDTTGSSPWVRGTRTKKGHFLPFSRFIPVGTGNTIACPPYFIHGRGSSPWVRGTPSMALIAVFSVRFIPVGTGNTFCPFRFGFRFTVHPRGYGEHLLPPSVFCVDCGSSPWVRGTPK